jgi:hypothetical protein
MTPGGAGTDRERQLREEARHLHAALFGSSPPPDLVDDYVRVHQFYCDPGSDRINLQLMVARRLDVEALELVLRRRNPALTRKLRIVLYLAEARPFYYSRLVNHSDRRVRAWLALAGAAARTLAKRVKGRLLLRRHAVV